MKEATTDKPAEQVGASSMTGTSGTPGVAGATTHAQSSAQDAARTIDVDARERRS